LVHDRIVQAMIWHGWLFLNLQLANPKSLLCLPLLCKAL
jgi:hypothetical protein